MPNSQCSGTPAFTLVGGQFYVAKAFNFQATFSDPGSAADVQLYEWFLDDILVMNITGNTLAGNLACGLHKVGLRIMTGDNWSGIKELGFVTCKLVETFTISGPDSLTAGDSATYHVIGTFNDGTTIDLTSSYIFSISDGGAFTDNLLTTVVYDTDDDFKEVTITATTTDSTPLTKDLKINNPNYADAGVLIVDLFRNELSNIDYSLLNVVGYISDADVTHNYQPAYTGHNTVLNLSPPAEPLILASDYISQDILKWRFEFNLARLKHNHPNKEHFTMCIAGRADVPSTINGAFNMQNIRAEMILTGSPGSYLPSTTGGENIHEIVSFMSYVADGATGSYEIADLMTIVKLNFDVASNTVVSTTNSGASN